MKIYIQNLLHRLDQFSKKIDRTELFLDKPWVIIDEEKNYQKYIFKRNGELIMSLNGKVEVGNWEYLKSVDSLLIDRLTDKILLNQLYFDDALMALKTDGFKDDYFILANEILIPDLNIENYLKKIVHRKFNVVTGKLTNGNNLEIYLEDNFTPEIGMRATLEGHEIDHELVTTEKTNTQYEIKNSQIVKISYPREYQINETEFIRIEQRYPGAIATGDLVYLNDTSAPDGKYKIGFMKHIKVINGVIHRKSVL